MVADLSNSEANKKHRPVVTTDDQENTEESEFRVIIMEANIREENDRIAQQNRAYLEDKRVVALNLISSPGAGKTTLLVETLNAIKDEIHCAVIEGDQQTSNDAKLIAKTGVPVVQINTRECCHLEALQVGQAFEALPMDEVELLFVENVGNLICPAGFDLGEAEKVAIMSITEGEDKPIKYPLCFHLANVLVLTKMDLLPYLRFDLDLCKQYVLRINPKIQIIETSVYAHQGIEDWLDLLRARVRQSRSD